MATLVDRLLARWGYTRAASGRAPGQDHALAVPAFARSAVRQYAAGRNSTLTHDAERTDWHINQALYRNLRALRAFSRDLARNNDYARQFLRMVKTNVVGANGFGLQVHARYQDGRLDERDSKRCEDAFWAWGKREACDFTGRLSWIELQQLYIETVARDGEILVRRVRGKGPFGYQLQFLDASLLDETLYQDLPNGRRIRMGLELDDDSRVHAYYLVKDDLADPRLLTVYGRRYVRVPAEEIWHDFLVEQVGQLRGVPWMATSLVRQKRLGSFETAAVAAAEEGAKKLAWIKTPTGELGALADKVDGTSNSQTEMPPPTSGTLYTENGDGVHYAGLPPGYEMQSWDPKYPDQAFGDFVKSTLRGISAGLGVPYHSLANDLEGVNFSSTRAGELEAREVWKSLQGWMSERFCARVYSEWLPIAIVSGKLSLPMDKLAKFDAAVWQGRRWSWVDPKKDVDAHVIAVENGFTSRARVIREMGYDPEEVWAELEREKEQLKDLLTPKQPAPALANPPAEDDDTQTEGEEP